MWWSRFSSEFCEVCRSDLGSAGQSQTRAVFPERSCSAFSTAGNVVIPPACNTALTCVRSESHIGYINLFVCLFVVVLYQNPRKSEKLWGFFSHNHRITELDNSLLTLQFSKKTSLTRLFWSFWSHHIVQTFHFSVWCYSTNPTEDQNQQCVRLSLRTFCLSDQCIVAFGLIMGFVVNKKNIEYLQTTYKKHRNTKCLLDSAFVKSC